ncbi:MAG: rhomboid family intramembrane serine protease [Pelovirga sp.]
MSHNSSRHLFFIKNSLRGRSLVQILIYTNLGLFTLMVLHGTILGLGMQVIFRPSTNLLVHWGGQYWPLVLEGGQWWRSFTYAFTHGGLIHLGFNMIVLYQVGPLLESEIGWNRFLSVYSVTTLVATIAGLFWHPNVVTVGASGAIFGLIGFSVSYYHRIGGHIGLQRRNFMFQWAVLAFIFGIMIGADNAAHLGGLLSGAAMGWWMPVSIRAMRQTDRFFKIGGIFFTAAIIISILCIPLSWVVR